MGWLSFAALGYFVLALLALTAGEPPGFAVAIWPAAGVALAAAIRLGYKACAAIFLASFAANLAAHFAGGLTSIVAGLGIGFGAAAQAAFALFLIGRFVTSATRANSVVAFVFLAGPVSCVVSASAGLMTLLALGVEQPENAVAAWLTWWAGDSIGVILVAPIVLCRSPRSPRWAQRSQITLLLLACLGLVGASQGVTKLLEQSNASARFQADADRVFSSALATFEGPLKTLASGEELDPSKIERSADAALGSKRETLRLVLFDHSTWKGVQIYPPSKPSVQTPGATWLKYEQAFELSGGKWAIRIEPRGSYEVHVRSSFWRAILFSGLFVSILLSILTLLVTGRSADLQAAVQERTAELSAANAELEDAMAEQQRSLAKRREFEQRLELAERREALALVAGGMAHDFNNAMASILGLAEFALLDLPADSRARDTLHSIVNATVRTRDVTDRINAFSRRATSQGDSNCQRVTADVLSVVRASLRSNVEIQSLLGEHPLMVPVSAGDLQHLILNLAINAQHAMPNGGMLTLELTGVSLDEAAAKAAKLTPGAYAKLSVADTGTGIEAKNLARVFDPYFTTKGSEGTGLGLAAALGIADSAGGTIAVESQVGTGTCFSVFLPIVKAKPAPPLAETESKVLAPNRALKLLLVDDEALIVKTFKALLQAKGYEVTEAFSAEEGLEIFKQAQGSFGIVLTDQDMPGMPGTAFLEALRAIQPDLPIVLWTGHSGGAELISRDEKTEFLTKPVKFAVLTSTIERLSCLPSKPPETP